MTAPSADPERRPSLPREVTLLLVQFAVAVAKTRTYPPGHPAMEGAVTLLMGRLATVLQQRADLTMAVARHQIIIDGAASDASSAIIRELALRLHRHQIGAVTLGRGVGQEELLDVLRQLGDEGWRQGTPLGLEPVERLNRWRHCRLHPMARDRFALSEGGAPTSLAADVWMGLAASLGGEGGGLGEGDPAQLARALEEKPREAESDGAVVDALGKVSAELGELSGQEGDVLRSRVASMIEHVRPDTLRTLLEVGADLSRRRQLVLDAARSLPVPAVMSLLYAAADASDRTISHAMESILGKLATHAESESVIAGQAEFTLRDAVRQLAFGWTADEEQGSSARRMLELLAHGPEEDRGEVDGTEENLRLLRMALEMGGMGPAVTTAADRLSGSASGLQAVLDLLDQEGDDDETTATLWAFLSAPERIRRLADQAHDDAGRAAVARLVARAGLAAVEPLLDALEHAEEIGVRRQLLGQLSSLGPGAAPLLVARLEQAPWYLQRNILDMLEDMMEGWPPGFSPARYARSEEPRVRREAIRLMVRHPRLRDQGIQIGLADPDASTTQTALTAALEDCPSGAVPLILNRLQAGLPPDTAALAVRALGSAGSTAARDWLVQRAMTRTRWLKRKRLADKTPELLAALEVLAARWPAHPAVAEVLALAARHGDEEIRAAARAGGAR